MGILPKHLWQDVKPEEFPFSPLNINPIGSGPYKVGKAVTSPTGSIIRYDLEPFKNFALGTPYLRRISFAFFPNEDALLRAFNRGDVDSVAAISPNSLSSITRTDIAVRTVPLPRIFGIFFNQGRNAVLADMSVRRALDQAVVKERVVQLVLRGYGVAIDSPVPPHVLSLETHLDAAPMGAVHSAYTEESLATARATLQKGGWKFQPAATSTADGGDGATGSWTNSKKQELSFTLATAETPELMETANAVAAAWLELGVKVNVQIFPISELNVNVIRPREYDAILFGEVVGRELDLFAFWHSSQRNDPGLNLALYTNSRTDTLLSQARATTQIDERKKLYAEFGDLVKNDVPAIFLYSPKFIYAVPKSLLGLELGSLTGPAERFHSAYRWYTDTEKVWGVFTDYNQQL
jgi:peptide/nickel transport system substrate-binding protein